MTLAPRTGKDAQSIFRECFGAPRALVGMLHLGALPGTPSGARLRQWYGSEGQR